MLQPDRLDGPGVQHLGAEVGELGRLAEVHLLYLDGVGDYPGVGGHESVHVRPYLQHVGAHGVGYHGGGVVRPSSSEGQGLAFRGDPVVSGYHRHDPHRQQGRDVHGHSALAELEVRRPGERVPLCDDPSVLRRDGLGLHAHPLEDVGQQERREPLALADDAVLVERVVPVGVDGLVEGLHPLVHLLHERVHGLPLEKLGRGRDVLVHELLPYRLVVHQRVLHDGDEEVRHPGHGRRHDYPLALGAGDYPGHPSQCLWGAHAGPPELHHGDHLRCLVSSVRCPDPSGSGL